MHTDSVTYVNANSRPSFIVQTLSFMHCACNFICGLSDVIIKTFSQSVSQSDITSLCSASSSAVNTTLPALFCCSSPSVCTALSSKPAARRSRCRSTGQHTTQAVSINVVDKIPTEKSVGLRIPWSHESSPTSVGN